MTTPAYNAVYQILDDAYHDAGLLKEGDTPNGEQVAAGMRRLTDVIMFEQTQGLKLWTLLDTPVTLVAGQAKYTFKPSGDVNMTRPLRAIQGYYLDANSIRRPLTSLSWNEYLMLGNVTNQGAVNSYFVDKQATEIDVTFWLVPDATAATGTAHVLLQQQLTQFTGLTETMNFPLEWRIFLRWATACELSQGQPETIMNRCMQMAERYRAALEAWDIEDTQTTFAPDQRASYQTGRFR